MQDLLATLVAAARSAGRWVAYLDDPAFGGAGDGVTLNDGPCLAALESMPPEGGVLVLRGGGTWRFDHVDLARVGRRNVTLLATGATLLKDAATPGHMFQDTAGTSDGLRVVGGTFDLSAPAFRYGQVASAFFLVRASDLTFVDAVFRNGIEEGLKLYKPRRVRVHRCRFERLVNNGLQLHVPAGADGYTGDGPDRGTSDVQVTACHFRDVDDGLHGNEGQGLSISGAHPRLTARDVLVSRCTFDGCVRGAWAEFNEPGNPGLEIRFDDNVVRGAEFHGLGLVGVRGGGLRGNQVEDPGRPEPPGVRAAASEVVGLVLSGSPGTRGEDLVVEGNRVRDTRPPGAARMEYGIVVRQQRRLTLRDNVVVGATVRPLDVDRGSVEDSTLTPPRTGPDPAGE